MPNPTTAQTFDCGDGGPDLFLPTDGRETVEPATHLAATVDTTTAGPTPVGAPLAYLTLTIAGQVVILLAVLAGGNPVIGAAAGLGLLICALTALGARHLRRAPTDR